MTMMGDGYTLLIAAIGEVPSDIQFVWMDEISVEQARFRVVPFEFEGTGREDSGRVKCIHPDWFERFDGIVGAK